MIWLIGLIWCDFIWFYLIEPNLNIIYNWLTWLWGLTLFWPNPVMLIQSLSPWRSPKQTPFSWVTQDSKLTGTQQQVDKRREGDSYNWCFLLLSLTGLRCWAQYLIDWSPKCHHRIEWMVEIEDKVLIGLIPLSEWQIFQCLPKTSSKFFRFLVSYLYFLSLNFF